MFKISQHADAMCRSPAIRALPYALIIFLCAYYFRIGDGDTFHLVASGRLTTLHGWPIRTDPFAYTVTKPVWIDHEWLSAVIFYGVSQLGGDLSLFTLTCVLGYLTVVALLWAQQSLNQSEKRCNPLLFLSLFPCSFIWNSSIRPLTLSFFLFATLVALLEVYRRTGRRFLLFALPLVLWIWVNAHGSFIVGWAYLFMTCGCRVIRHKGRTELPLISAGLVSLMTPLATPYGWSFIPFILNSVTMSRPLIPEWSWTQLHLSNAIFYGIALITLLTLATEGRKRIPMEVSLFLVISLAAAIKSQRNIPYFLFTASVYLPASLDSLLATFGASCRSRAKTLSQVCCGLMWAVASVGAVTLLYATLTMGTFKLDYSRQPVETFAWLARHARGGNVLTHFNHGSYVLFHGYPRFRVSLDARYDEVYPNETVERVLQALQPYDHRFDSAFTEVLPDFVLACRDTTALTDESLFAPGWRKVFTGDKGRCSIFVQNVDLINGSAPNDLNSLPWKPHF